MRTMLNQLINRDQDLLNPNSCSLLSLQGKPGKDGDPGQSGYTVLFYCATSVYAE